MACVFCLIIKKEIPATIVRETDSLIVIVDKFPQRSNHLLIIPKFHVENINTLTSEQFSIIPQIVALAKELAQEYGNLPDQGFTLTTNNGKSSEQVVHHMHWHFLSGTPV